MPPPYDTVISIGGQSLIDGVWRIFGPALERLTNPLPITLPGFSNAAMRITSLAPAIPQTPPTTGGLQVRALVEVSAEALLKLNLETGGATISLGSQPLNLTDITGTILSGKLSEINISGTLPGPGAGSLKLGPAMTPPNGTLKGTLDLGNVTVPGIPLPAVVPVAVDLTPTRPLEISAVLELSASNIDATTAFGLRIGVTSVNVGAFGLDPAVATALTNELQTAATKMREQLGVPNTIGQPIIDTAAVNRLLAPVQGALQSALSETLGSLVGATGRLVFPPAGAGASCQVSSLPTSADTRLSVNAPAMSYALEVGFSSPGSSSAGIAAFPPLAPSGLVDTTLTIGNMFLLRLLCCLVERLPGFSFPAPVSFGTSDAQGGTHVMCGTFNGSTITIGPVALMGGLSVCIDGMTGSTKTVTLVGRFAQGAPFHPLPLATIDVSFTLPLIFDLDDTASIANLRLAGGLPTIAATVAPSTLFVIGIVLAGISTFFLAMPVGTILVAMTLAIVWALCNMASMLLNSAIRTVLGAASLVRSPVAIPPGILEAFGGLVPVTVTIDDLTARSVLQTPTSPWTLIPRLRILKKPPPGSGSGSTDFGGLSSSDTIAREQGG